MPRTIVRTGRQRALLAAGPVVVADVLSDPVAVTALLGDLLDQERSQAAPPTRWVVPRIRLGLTTFDTTLVPTFTRDGHDVLIEARTTEASDAQALLAMDLRPQERHEGCRLETDWRLELRVPLPRTALRFAGPALDRTVASTVQRIMDRTEEAVAQQE